MPPKPKISNRQLQELMEEKNIFYKGSVSVREWPPEHAHHFTVIDEISQLRYDEYMASGAEEANSLRHRIQALRLELQKLRAEFSPTETMFRIKLEPKIFWRFDQAMQCQRCKAEVHVVDYEAQPSLEEERQRLAFRRASRKAKGPCACDRAIGSGASDIGRSSGSDFHTLAESTAVKHIPDEGLSRVKGIHVCPDRLVGLENTPRYRRSTLAVNPEVEYMPTENRNLLLPFLVVEAKREREAPGFRAIEMQTAFPIRSLLNTQENLHKASRGVLQPLVWFFGFQGDIWRLYAGTLRGGKVEIYDLWLGSIESRNSALQLFQIVDFIWSWARDVYRPQVRRCLEDREFVPRAPSPTSTAILSRAVSVVSDRTTHTRQSFQTPSTQPPRTETLEPGRSSQTCVRRANAVIFSCVLMASTLNSVVDMDLVRSLGSYGTLLCLTMQQILSLMQIWAGTSTEVSISDNGKSFVALIFNTFCDPDSWQIHRKLYFIVFPNYHGSITAEHVVEASSEQEELAGAMEAVRDLTGAASVSYALQGIELILGNAFSEADQTEGVAAPTTVKLTWQHPQDDSAMRRCVNTLLTLPNENTLGSFTGEPELLVGQELLAAGHSTIANHYFETDLPLPGHVETLPAMLTVRPSSWEQRCPRFCLFVFRRSDFDDRARHRQLVRLSLSMRRYYGVLKETPVLSDDDRATLREWVRSLRTH